VGIPGWQVFLNYEIDKKDAGRVYPRSILRKVPKILMGKHCPMLEEREYRCIPF
jgi:hypothetical protein